WRCAIHRRRREPREAETERSTRGRHPEPGARIGVLSRGKSISASEEQPSGDTAEIDETHPRDARRERRREDDPGEEAGVVTEPADDERPLEPPRIFGVNRPREPGGEK